MMSREVTEVLEQVTECGKVVVREQMDKVTQVAGLLVRGELCDGQE